MNRAEEKKQWEVGQGELVAQAINTAHGTDYIAEPARREPADVVLTSRSGKFPPLNAQVVSIPLDFRHRDDKHTVERVQQKLAERLNSAGVRDALVGLTLSGEAETYGIDRELVEKLAELILDKGRDNNLTLNYGQIYEYSAEMAERVHNIFVSHHPELIAETQIDIPAGSAVPRDGRWIHEGIQKKLEKYGGDDAVKDLTLDHRRCRICGRPAGGRFQGEL